MNHDLNGNMQVTFNELRKPEVRGEMQESKVISIGTQSGGFGSFTEMFRAISLTGSCVILSELQSALGNYQEIIDECPTLKELLK